jgi:hypothetical protein
MASMTLHQTSNIKHSVVPKDLKESEALLAWYQTPDVVLPTLKPPVTWLLHAQLAKDAGYHGFCRVAAMKWAATTVSTVWADENG